MEKKRRIILDSEFGFKEKTKTREEDLSLICCHTVILYKTKQNHAGLSSLTDRSLSLLDLLHQPVGSDRLEIIASDIFLSSFGKFLQSKVQWTECISRIDFEIKKRVGSIKRFI